MEEQVTNKDILDAINVFSTNMDNRFDGVEGRLDGVEGRLDGVEGRLDGVEGHLDGVEGHLSTLESKMDEGFASLRSEILEVKAELTKLIEKWEKRTREDSDVSSSDYLALKVRVEKMEKQLQKLQFAQN